MQKKRNVLIMLLTLVIVICYFPKTSIAASQDVSGGVQNEYTYQEVVFISGKPVTFKGSNKDIKITEKVSKDKVVQTYSLKLIGSNNKDSLTRNISYESNVADYLEIGQKTINGKVSKFTEKIVIDGVTYTLTDFQYSNGTVVDNRVASDYFSGNIVSRKIYTVPGKRNEPEKEYIVTTDSRHVGYENFWGATETQITEYEITNPTGQVGYVKNRISKSKSRVLNYEENPATLASFNGGYIVISSKDVVSDYTYDLPYGAGTGQVSLNTENMPTIERLIVPKFRDITNSYAKEPVEKLYSLGIYDENSSQFLPKKPMSRYDFAIALAKVVDLRVLQEKKTKAKTTTTIFKDVKSTVKNYAYLETALKKGIIQGVSKNSFLPQGSITRGQAATIIVRALGLENRAPDPVYSTRFSDDSKIKGFERDGVYMVNELGIMSGDGSNFNPGQSLNREQASVILVRVLEYLERDLKQNYRDDILFLN